jgi:excisionase family DNA binding protein
MVQQNKHLSVQEVSAMFGVSVDAVRGWIQRGTLPSVKLGRRVFVERSAVENLKTRTVKR